MYVRVCSPNQVSSSSSLTRHVANVCVCVYDYVLWPTESHPDSSLTKTNHPAGLVGHVAQITATSVGMERA